MLVDPSDGSKRRERKKEKIREVEGRRREIQVEIPFISNESGLPLDNGSTLMWDLTTHGERSAF